MMLPWKSEGALHCTFTDFLGLDVLKEKKTTVNFGPQQSTFRVLYYTAGYTFHYTRRYGKRFINKKCVNHQLKTVTFNTVKLIIQNMQNCSKEITTL